MGVCRAKLLALYESITRLINQYVYRQLIAVMRNIRMYGNARDENQSNIWVRFRILSSARSIGPVRMRACIQWKS
jgi:hypothetical protein